MREAGCGRQDAMRSSLMRALKIKIIIRKSNIPATFEECVDSPAGTGERRASVSGDECEESRTEIPGGINRVA